MTGLSISNALVGDSQCQRNFSKKAKAETNKQRTPAVMEVGISARSQLPEIYDRLQAYETGSMGEDEEENAMNVCRVSTVATASRAGYPSECRQRRTSAAESCTDSRLLAIRGNCRNIHAQGRHTADESSDR